MQIRYTVGWKAYFFLKKDLKLPLPSYSTLCRHIAQLDFSPGILKDVISLMKKKKETHTSSHQSDCVLLMDEMDICKTLEYDVSTGSFFGQTTYQEDIPTLSSNVIVFMLRGLNDNWKQVIAWHLTTKTSDEKVMCGVILEIIDEIEKIGYKVHGLVSDMGPKNQAVWRTLGMKVGKDNNTPFITHPIRSHESLCIFPDVPHLLKNLRSALMNNLIIKVALTIVQSQGLPCNEVRFRYLEQLEESQRRYQLKLAPNITVDILKPSNFNKMSVAAAAHIFNERTAAALETLVQLQIMERDALTTAWFLRTVILV
ncbi:unnamed protein product [Lasius platythorax]|uniref:Transposase n=1 Tax=Lasius platythorax TaxID=488582 RepID=A0AAV2NMD6_9HYME